MSRRWCFTLNNYSPADEVSIKQWDTKYLVFGREVGESGTPHLQGFVTFPKLYLLTGVKKLHPTAHWEVTKFSSLTSSDYCKKGSQSKSEWDSDGIRGPSYGIDSDVFERGTPPTPGKRTDLDELCLAAKSGSTLKEISEISPATYVRNYRGIAHYKSLHVNTYKHHDVRGFWLHGRPGTGKSHFVSEMFPNAYKKSQNKWFDGYSGEAVIVLDDFDFTGQCLGHHLKIWLDKYPCSAETKGGQVELQHRAFIITSNYHPSDIFGYHEGDKETGQDMMLAAITRRVKIHHFTKIFTPPPIGSSGPGDWSPTVVPSLPDSFVDETSSDS